MAPDIDNIIEIQHFNNNGFAPTAHNPHDEVLEQIKLHSDIPLTSLTAAQIHAARMSFLADGVVFDEKNGHSFDDMLEFDASERLEAEHDPFHRTLERSGFVERLCAERMHNNRGEECLAV